MQWNGASCCEFDGKSLETEIKTWSEFPNGGKAIVEQIIPSEHRTIIQTGITCQKIPCYMRNSASRWLIVENAKIFQCYVGIERNCRILIGLCK